MIEFEYLNKSDFSAYSQTIFDILSGNMTKIAPTGNTLEEDFKMWNSCVSEALQRDERQMILVKDKEKLVGFFQYYTNEETFAMEEIQFKPEYQGKGVFRELYSFVFENIKSDLKYVKAYASIEWVKYIRTSLKRRCFGTFARFAFERRQPICSQIRPNFLETSSV